MFIENLPVWVSKDFDYVKSYMISCQELHLGFWRTRPQYESSLALSLRQFQSCGFILTVLKAVRPSFVLSHMLYLASC